ncbi:PH (Pleckstrin Homology) domain-containing protein [Chryseobacterium sp. 52]|uniref:PH domain-containing protein n=1 Tax=Chryseobacterium sp. 52 TaxID=2035213 RepID=UPI000C184535|nr:PH domain-containing protein [Chryseobacterium sp. 52]PIF46119.1 PH (Pleckstrin Homology) domain-containing protein [Chryseobacterium sp. 52]
MGNICALCNAELTSIDTLLGENKLSDGGNLCNKCLDKVSSIHQELLYNLNAFSINDIKSLVQTGKIEPETEQPKEIAQEIQIENRSVFINPDEMPHDLYKRRLKEIKYQLQRVGANLSMFTKGEIKELPHIIGTDEIIIAATDAQFLNTVDAGILLVTPKRIVSVSKAMFSPVKVNEYTNETITEVSFVSNSISPIIKLHIGNKVIDFECFYDRQDAEIFYNFIEKIYNKEIGQKQLGATKEVASNLIFEQLEKLGKLRESGILTEEEFAEQKKKLLDQIS